METLKETTPPKVPGVHYGHNKIHGTLTEENYKEVAKLLHDLLTGKEFTWIGLNEWTGFVPEIRRGQKVDTIKSFEEKISLSILRGISVHDTYGGWDLRVREGDDAIRFQFHKHPEDRPFATFELTAPAGHRLVWTVLVDGDAREDEEQASACPIS